MENMENIVSENSCICIPRSLPNRQHTKCQQLPGYNWYRQNWNSQQNSLESQCCGQLNIAKFGAGTERERQSTKDQGNSRTGNRDVTEWVDDTQLAVSARAQSAPASTVHAVESTTYKRRSVHRVTQWGNWLALGQVSFGSVTITFETSTDGATTLSRMNLSGYVGVKDWNNPSNRLTCDVVIVATVIQSYSWIRPSCFA